MASIATVRRAWERMAPAPGGRAAFSRLLGLAIPYTGSIRPRVEELGPGWARVSMRDRRAVRNHLRSVHAIALVNLAELTGNLAVLYGAPADARAIITGISISYVKKARGRITATCRAEVPETNAERTLTPEVELRDPAGDLVATATVDVRMGPVPGTERAGEGAR